MSHMPLLLLAIESATPALSCAVLRGEELVAEVLGTPGQHHAEAVLPQVEEVLTRSGLSLEDIEAFAVSIGPGSFTSLRIGLATVKGLAFATPRLVAPVSTLRALAQGLETRQLGDRLLVALLDARRSEAYAAGYVLQEAELKEVIPEGVYTPAALAEQISAPCLLIGEGAALFGPEIREALGAGVEIGPADPPSAASVGILGARCHAAGGAVTADILSPKYVRRAEAEVLRDAQR
jgi:tRNA threonylcarbamoyladenosine biosynthesis protein TsaB